METFSIVVCFHFRFLFFRLGGSPASGCSLFISHWKQCTKFDTENCQFCELKLSILWILRICCETVGSSLRMWLAGSGKRLQHQVFCLYRSGNFYFVPFRFKIGTDNLCGVIWPLTIAHLIYRNIYISMGGCSINPQHSLLSHFVAIAQ